jgi:hypothetical protein
VSDTTASDYAPSNVIDLTARLGGSKPPGAGGPLQPPGGGGTSDGMLEARVASLEEQVKNIREDVAEIKADQKSAAKDIGEIKVDFARATERMTHFPTKTYIGATITAGAGFIILAITLLSHFGILVAGAPK